VGAVRGEAVQVRGGGDRQVIEAGLVGSAAGNLVVATVNGSVCFTHCISHPMPPLLASLPARRDAQIV